MDILPFFLEDDEELLAYHILNRTSYFYRLDKNCKPFDLNDLTNEFCRVHFRFLKEDLRTLKVVLRIPDVLECSNSSKVGGLEALCIMLKRLSYPNRYADMMPYFPRTRCELSRIFNKMVEFIVEKHGHLIQNLDWITINDLGEYAQALHLKGSPYSRCIGFLDGTVRPICRPTVGQREYYTGHKRVHALKFQSMHLPNGLIANLYGPVPGRRHDAFLLESSKLSEKLENLVRGLNNPYYLYGDQGYPLLPNLIVPFKGQNLTPGQRQCNKSMSSIRESVEWGFGKIVQNFGFLDFKKNLKIGMQSVGNYYLAGAILINCHTCLYGSETSDYFNCQPPTLDSYIN